LHGWSSFLEPYPPRLDKEMKRFLGPLAALSFLVGAELDALLHGDWVPSPYVIIGAIVVGVVVGYVIAVGRD